MAIDLDRLGCISGPEQVPRTCPSRPSFYLIFIIFILGFSARLRGVVRPIGKWGFFLSFSFR